MTASELYLSLNGRIDRSTYWLKGLLPITLINIALIALDSATHAKGAITMFAGALLIWPSTAMVVKRLHDRDKPAWWIFVFLIPFIGWLWGMVEVCFLPGTSGRNSFDDVPGTAARNVT